MDALVTGGSACPRDRQQSLHGGRPQSYGSFSLRAACPPSTSKGRPVDASRVSRPVTIRAAKKHSWRLCSLFLWRNRRCLGAAPRHDSSASRVSETFSSSSVSTCTAVEQKSPEGRCESALIAASGVDLTSCLNASDCREHIGKALSHLAWSYLECLYVNKQTYAHRV